MADSIKYTSTRGGEQNLSFDDVLLTGLARDGGLYMPESWPSFSYKKLYFCMRKPSGCDNSFRRCIRNPKGGGGAGGGVFIYDYLISVQGIHLGVVAFFDGVPFYARGIPLGGVAF